MLVNATGRGSEKYLFLLFLLLLEVDDFKLLLPVVGAGVHHVQQYHVTRKGSL